MHRGDPHAARSAEGIDDHLTLVGALVDQDLGDPHGLLRGVAAVDPRLLQDVGDAEILELTLALFEEEDHLVARAVVVAHADLLLVPDQGLPEAEAGLLADGAGDEHRLLVAVEVEVTVGPQDPVELAEEPREAAVGEDVEPVVAGGLAVLEPGGGAHGAVLLQRLVGGIGDDQVHRLAGQGLEPLHGVELREPEVGGLGGLLSCLGASSHLGSLHRRPHPSSVGAAGHELRIVGGVQLCCTTRRAGVKASASRKLTMDSSGAMFLPVRCGVAHEHAGCYNQALLQGASRHP